MLLLPVFAVGMVGANAEVKEDNKLGSYSNSFQKERNDQLVMHD